MIYFDNSSTTRPSVGVINAVNTAMSECFANASSLHIEGVTAHKVIDEAKKIIARSLGCTPMEILLGSGGTFCNNLAESFCLRLFLDKGYLKPTIHEQWYSAYLLNKCTLFCLD